MSTVAARRRTTAALFATVALMNAAMAAASPTSTIITADQLGPAWGGVPNTAGIVGTGLGAILLTRAANRHGWRPTLLAGYAAAAFGAAFAVTGITGHDLLVLTAGMLLLGLGNAAAWLSRYAAAELYPAHRRGFVIGTVVWAGAIGAVGGPQLLAPAAAVTERLGWGALAGPVLLAALVSAVAGVVVLALPAAGPTRFESHVPVRDLLRTPPARLALVVMATAQVVMVAVMTAAPVDMHMHHQGLGMVGAILSAHTLGMFALSPLTGWLLDRIGGTPVVVAGLGALAASTVLLAAVPDGATGIRAAGLFLLGYGWNLCFVGGSGGLSAGLPATDRARVEGAVDAGVWGAAAAASVASTVLLSAGGYPVLALAAGVLVVVPALLLLNPSARRTSDRAGNTVAAPHTAPHTAPSRSPHPTSGIRS